MTVRTKFQNKNKTFADRVLLKISLVALLSSQQNDFSQQHRNILCSHFSFCDNFGFGVSVEESSEDL
jgi:hypothetical protein